MDPIHSLNFETDSTIALIKEAQRRNFEIYYYIPAQIFLSSGKVFAKCQTVSINSNEYKLGEVTTINLENFDVILMRQDPPFDMNYITSTYLLEKLQHPIIVNNPTEVRNLPEKLFICNYPEFTPSTVITQDFAIAKEFLSQHAQVVIKPLYAFGGEDISLITNENQMKREFDHLIKKYNAAVIVQKFLPEVKVGDKRIILINGNIAGAVNRIPASGSIKANLAAGGIAVATEITAYEHEMCQIIGQELVKRGIVIAGLDIIGKYVTEVNVTCPTTFNAINNIYGLRDKERIEALVWDSILNNLYNSLATGTAKF
jgi:glutathione synthase